MTTYTDLTTIPDTLLTPFVHGAEHCAGKSVPYFEQRPPEPLSFDEVGRQWALISQKPVAPHTIAQLRWVVCDTGDALFRRAELNSNYYVRRDADQLRQMGRVLGQITNAMLASGDHKAGEVESLQNRIDTIEKEVRDSPDIHDWSWGKIAETCSLWIGGGVGSFVFLSVAFGYGAPNAPIVIDKIATRVHDWRNKKKNNKNDNDPKPPAPPAIGGGDTVADAATSHGEVGESNRVAVPRRTGWQIPHWVEGLGTFLGGIIVFAAMRGMPLRISATPGFMGGTSPFRKDFEDSGT